VSIADIVALGDTKSLSDNNKFELQGDVHIMKEKLASLIEVKKLIALMFSVCFIFLSCVGKVTAEQYLTVFSLVVAFYFGQSTAKNTK
jgi:hypothetical protein